MMMQGLRSVIYQVDDLEKAKEWYSKVLGIDPYFAEPFYVGFNVGGYELGLEPHRSMGLGGVHAYWGVEDIESEFKRLLEHGATEQSAIQDVGESIRVALVLDPFGNIFGIIENPHFSLASQ